MRSLQAFYLTTQTLKIADTASKMRVTPSAVSIQIKKLENELGTRLFGRNYGKLILTQKGSIFLQEIAPLFNIVEQAKLAVNEETGLFKNRLLISSVFDIEQYYFERILLFAKSHPKLTVAILCRSAWETISLVGSGEADFGLGRFGAVPKNLLSENVKEIDPFFVIPRSHPLTQKANPKLADISAYPLVVLPKGTAFRSSIESRFRKANQGITVAIEPATCHDIKLCVAAGLGIGISHSICLTPSDSRRFYLVNGRSLLGSSVIKLVFRKKGRFCEAIREELLRCLLD
jgi:DNA-binding transcriptional LysR family regulator